MLYIDYEMYPKWADKSIVYRGKFHGMDYFKRFAENESRRRNYKEGAGFRILKSVYVEES